MRSSTAACRPRWGLLCTSCTAPGFLLCVLQSSWSRCVQDWGCFEHATPSPPCPLQLAQAECEVEQLQWQAAQAKRENSQLARKGPSNAAVHGAAPQGMQAAPAAGPAEQQGAPLWDSAMQAQRQPSLTSSAAASAVGASGSGAGARADCAQGGAQCADSLGDPPPWSDSAARQGLHGGGGNGGVPCGADEAAELAAAAVADPLAGMYGTPPPHEEFDSLLSRFQAQVGSGWPPWRAVPQPCCPPRHAAVRSRQVDMHVCSAPAAGLA